MSRLTKRAAALMGIIFLVGNLPLNVAADEPKRAADYEKHIDIWGEYVPGNTGESKLSCMNINTETNYGDIASEFSKVIVGGDYKEAEQTIDSMTYYAEIQPGYESERFDDRPYLIPYPADNRKVVLSRMPETLEVSGNAADVDSVSENEVSKNAVSRNKVSKNAVSRNTVSKNVISRNKVSKNAVSKNSLSKDAVSRNTISKNGAALSGGSPAVIIISGGAYTYKSMDGSDFESKDIAIALNSYGISAFVLHYRSNPYEYPYPWLDLQRAVRHLRFYAEDYGIDPEKISILGCSAGGNLAGTFINEIRGEDLLPEEYLKDEIDCVSDIVASAALIYPVTTFKYNISMLFAAFPAAEVQDGNRRNELLNKMDLASNFNSADIPQIVCYGTADRLVNHEGTLEYVSAAKNAGADIESYQLEGLDHAFRCDNYIDGYVKWLKEKVISHPGET